MATGGFQFMLEAAKYYSPPASPNDSELLAGLDALPGATVIEEHTYFDWSNRLAPLVDVLRSNGQWALPHPWIEHFGSSFPAFAARKARFDPNGVLTPGQGIFRGSRA